MERICSVDVAEVFSPPRVTLEAKKFGLKRGEAFDLTSGWDFRRKDHQETAEKYVDAGKPLVIIGSPPCIAFSQLQTLNAKTANSTQRLQEGIDHMKIIARLYRKQVSAGRALLHGQLQNATSWMLGAVQRMVKEEGVTLVEADHCMYG